MIRFFNASGGNIIINNEIPKTIPVADYAGYIMKNFKPDVIKFKKPESEWTEEEHTEYTKWSLKLSMAHRFKQQIQENKPIVLILDEWLLLKLTEAEARNLFELIHKRRKNLQQSFVLNSVKVNGTSKSVMVKVLLPMPSWIVFRMIPIKSILKSVDPAKDLSMREVYGLDPAMAK